MKILNCEKNQKSIYFFSSKRTRVNDIVCWFGVLGLFALLLWLGIYMAITDINEYIIQIVLFSLCLVGLAFLLIGAFYDTFLSSGFKLTIDESGIRRNAGSKQYIISWEEFKICSVVWNVSTGFKHKFPLSYIYFSDSYIDERDFAIKMQKLSNKYSKLPNFIYFGLPEREAGEVYKLCKQYIRIYKPNEEIEED